MSEVTKSGHSQNVLNHCEVQKSSGYRVIVSNFAETATIHGVGHFICSKSRTRRFVWFLIFFCGVGVLAGNIYVNFSKLLEHGVSTKGSLRYTDTLPFPAVTICNINTVKRSKVRNTLLPDYFKYLMYGEESGVNSSQEINLSNTIDYAGHNIQDVLKDCRWKGKQCGAENFTSKVITAAGKCFTFNSKNNSFIKSNEFDTTLQLTLDAQPEEYFDPWNDRVGFRVYLHEPGEPYQSTQGGLLISPGFAHHAAITREKKTLLPPPYPSGCVENADKGYSVSNCQRKCFDQMSQKICKCSSSGEDVSCTIKQAACLYSNLEQPPSDCYCPPTCVSMTYNTALSSATFPAKHKWPQIFDKYNITSFNDTDAFKFFFRERVLKLTVAFESFGTKEWEEVPLYGTRAFICDLGGIMGLYLGCSVLSVWELLELLFYFLRYFCRNPGTTKVQGA